MNAQMMRCTTMLPGPRGLGRRPRGGDPALAVGDAPAEDPNNVLEVGQLRLSSLCGSQLLLVLRLLLALLHDWEGHTVFAHRLLLYFEGRTSLRCALGWAEGYRVEFIE